MLQLKVSNIISFNAVLFIFKVVIKFCRMAYHVCTSPESRTHILIQLHPNYKHSQMIFIIFNDKPEFYENHWMHLKVIVRNILNRQASRQTHRQMSYDLVELKTCFARLIEHFNSTCCNTGMAYCTRVCKNIRFYNFIEVNTYKIGRIFT